MCYVVRIKFVHVTEKIYVKYHQNFIAYSNIENQTIYFCYHILLILSI